MKRLSLVSALMMMIIGSAATPTDEEWQELKEQARERHRAVIYDNDTDDAAAFPANLEPTVENYLRLRTSFLHQYPVDTIVYNANYGAFYQLITPTRVGERLDFRSPDSSKTINIVPLLHERGTDPLKLQIEYARQHNIEIFAGIRLNDTHDSADRPDLPCPFFSKWKREHPEFLTGAYGRVPPYGDWSSLDFSHPEVRDRFVAVVDELAENYDIDGIAIDLFRSLTLFKSVAWGGEATDAEREAFSDMFRKIRAVTEKHGRTRGRPILIAVRAPDSPEYCRAIGFELEKLMREGVFDLFFASDNLHLEPWEKSVELCRRYHIKCYASISMPSFTQFPKLSRHDPRSYYGRIAAAWQAGMDGMYYFNLFNENSVRNLMLGDASAYRLLDKRCHISDRILWHPDTRLAGGTKYQLLPELSPVSRLFLAPGAATELKLEFGDDPAALMRDGIPVRVNAVIIGGITPELFSVSSNGIPWKHLASSREWHLYEVPPDALHPGVNTIELSNRDQSGESREDSIYTGERPLRGAEQPPWRRLFPGNADHSRAETIVDGACRLADSGPGWANLLCPLANETKTIDLGFDLKVDSATDELGVMVRVACAGKVEIVSFTPERIKLMYAGSEVKFPTGTFHRYRLRLSASEVTLEADGRKLLSAPAAASSSDPATEMRGMVLTVPKMHTDSIVIGSLSDSGGGISHWKNLTLRNNRSSAIIDDLAVEVQLSPPPEPEKITEWQQENRGKQLLAAGNYAYKVHPTAAEIELSIDNGSALVLISGGGTFTGFTLHRDRIESVGNEPPFPLENEGGIIKLRVELNYLESRVFSSGKCVEIPAKNVSIALNNNDPALAGLDDAARKIIRNSGIVVVPSGDARVEALRVNVDATR